MRLLCSPRLFCFRGEGRGRVLNNRGEGGGPPCQPPPPSSHVTRPGSAGLRFLCLAS